MATNKLVKNKRGAQSVQSVELLPREIWAEDDEPEIDGPRINSSARRYTGEYKADVQTVYDDEPVPVQAYTTKRRASAPAANTQSNPTQRSGRRTITTTTTERRRDAAAHTGRNTASQHEETWSTRRSATKTDATYSERQRSSNLPTVRHSAMSQDQEQERETGKIKTMPVKKKLKLHWLTYVGIAMCSIVVVWVIFSLIIAGCKTIALNNEYPMPKTVNYTTVHLHNGHTAEIYGMIDSQDHLDAVIIMDSGKVQFVPGQNTSSVLPDPQHSIITAVVSQDGKTVVIHARGPYEDQGFETVAQEAQMVVGIDQIGK